MRAKLQVNRHPSTGAISQSIWSQSQGLLQAVPGESSKPTLVPVLPLPGEQNRPEACNCFRDSLQDGQL